MADKPHYSGHRQRLRERFLKGGPDALADYEMMEMVLFGAITRGDVKPLAKRVIGRFGSFAAAVSAEPERLREVEGLGEASIAAIKLVRAAALKLALGQILDQPILSSWQAVMDYLTAALSQATTERFHILYLDRKNRLIADEAQQQGTVDHTPVYPREVVKRALELSATALILVHNHPSGDPTPSAADIEMTKKIAQAAEAVGISLHDHIIIGQGSHASFKSLGLL